MQRLPRLLHRLALAAGLAACAAPAERAAEDSLAAIHADSVARARQDSANRARPDYIIDSILSPAEELRRFRAGLGDSLSRLEGGESSREALVRAFVRALEANDRSALARLLVTRHEYADLVYATSEYARPPMRTKPDVAWMLLVSENEKALVRLLDRLGGRPLGYASHRCAESRREGANRVWTSCTIRHARAPGDTAEVPLFASIFERDGRFKLYSLANPY
jgi:hypothetical protein